MNNQHLSAYTPSNMDTETLEAMFVQRHKLLEQSVQWVEESLFTGKKNHLLFVGPRGCGKTHLTTMIIRRLEEKHGDDFIYIWLGEDDVIMNFTSLALAIINKMASAYPKKFHNDCLEYAKGKSADEVADIIFADIKAQTGDKTLLIVKENMNDVFAGLKDFGQKRLRAHLQENHHLSILGTSQKLFDGIASRDSAFWGFFDVHHLSTLSVEDATQLIKNIANINGDDELVEFLTSSQGNYRIRALHHLAGGNHRLYVELASFLTKNSLDDFVNAITQLADHLTPYFQERIRCLSPQQAGIVQKLCELRGAIQVKVIAESLFIDERAVASQLKDLKDMGYVIAHKRGRASYYEIAEPLLRLSLEGKNNHGRPLKIIASLFRAWFSDEELKAGLNSSDKLVRLYSETAISTSKEMLSDLTNDIEHEMMFSVLLSNPREIIRKAEELSHLPHLKPEKKYEAIFHQAYGYQKLGDSDKSIDLIKTLPIKKLSPILKMKVLGLQALSYRNLMKIDKTIDKLSDILVMKKTLEEKFSPFTKFDILLERSNAFIIQNKLQEALADVNSIINLSKNMENTVRAKYNRSIIFESLDRNIEAMQDLDFVIETLGSPNQIRKSAYVNRAVALYEKGKFEEALKDLEKAQPFEETLGNVTSLLFALPELYYLTLQIDKARDSLSRAFKYGNNKDKHYSENSNELLSSIVKLGASHWKKEMDFLLPLYAEHGSLSSLTAGLTYSVSVFVQEEALHSSFRKWAALWKEACGIYPEMQPAVDAVVASAEALAEGNDKPLFVLPKEIRDLVRPMFNDVFG